MVKLYSTFQKNENANPWGKIGQNKKGAFYFLFVYIISNQKKRSTLFAKFILFYFKSEC